MRRHADSYAPGEGEHWAPTIKGILQQQEDQARQPVAGVMLGPGCVHGTQIPCQVPQQVDQGLPKGTEHLRAVHLQRSLKRVAKLISPAATVSSAELRSGPAPWAIQRQCSVQECSSKAVTGKLRHLQDDGVHPERQCWSCAAMRKKTCRHLQDGPVGLVDAVDAEPVIGRGAAAVGAARAFRVLRACHDGYEGRGR